MSRIVSNSLIMIFNPGITLTLMNLLQSRAKIPYFVNKIHLRLKYIDEKKNIFTHINEKQNKLPLGYSIPAVNTKMEYGIIINIYEIISKVYR